MTKKDEISKIENEEIIRESEKLLNEPRKPNINFGPPKVRKETKSFSTEEIESIQLHSNLTDKKYYLEPSTWIYHFNKLHKVVFTYKTDSVLKGGKKVDMETYKAFVRTTIKELGLSRHFNRQVVDDIITLWKSSEKAKFLSDFRSMLAFEKPSTDLVKAWVRAATGKDSHLDVAVMKHFIWQIRRKLHGLEVYHHVMPILYGKSGGGKSRAVSILLKSVDEVCLNMDLSIFSDQFRTRLFTKAFVMFFDEMAKSERADIDKLKNIITAECVDFRGMHTENLESAPQNCTFIGCSNDLVYDKIYDPTSARRYWQIDCTDKLDWKSINSIDYLALWKSVDEKQDSPILPYLNEIKEIQEKVIRSKDLIEDWIGEFLTPTQYDPSEAPTSSELYVNFQHYCEWQKIKNGPTFAKFCRRLPQIFKHIGWSVGPNRANNGTLWAVLCAPPKGTVFAMNLAAAQKKELIASLPKSDRNSHHALRKTPKTAGNTSTE